jgi:hypothetical protein
VLDKKCSVLSAAVLDQQMRNALFGGPDDLMIAGKYSVTYSLKM